MESCAHWIDIVGGIVAVGAFGYLALLVFLGAYVDRLVNAGADADQLPEVSWWSPAANLRLAWYVYGRPSRDIPSWVVFLLVVLLRVVMLPTLSAGIVLFLMLVASSNNPAECWSWLPQSAR